MPPPPPVDIHAGPRLPLDTFECFPHIIPRMAFDHGEWKVVEDPSNPIPRSPLPRPSQIKLATYNIWFGPYGPQTVHPRCPSRWKAVVDKILSLDADIIGLQEVTPESLKIILKDERIQKKNFFVSVFYPPTMSPYGCMMLSKIPPMETFWMPLPSTMRRYLVAMRFCFADDVEREREGEREREAGGSLCSLSSEFSRKVDVVSSGEREGGEKGGCTSVLTVGTVHLESVFDFNGPKIRKQQLEVLAPVLCEGTDSAVLMGDFNFVSERENTSIPPFFLDVWSLLRSDVKTEDAYTFDSAKNKCCQTHDRHRVDRVILLNKDERKEWKAKEIEIFGREDIEGLGHPPSDHFGLYCVLGQ